MPVGGRNPNAWNNWYHCVGSTYGTWLRGDPRGFRTFRHREHVDGDYRRPPAAGVWEPVFAKAESKLSYPPVVLNEAQRECMCRALVGKLEADGVEVVALAVASNHLHLLARFPLLDPADSEQFAAVTLRDARDPSPRHYLGRARRHASFALSAAGLKPESQVWAARPKCEPIRDRGHQVNTARYITQHAVQGAACWVLGRGFLFEGS